MGLFLQDLRYAVRTLGRDRGFFLIAVCMIGLGVGGSSTVFSLVNFLLVRPLPFREPDRLVWVANTESGEAGLSAQTLQVGHFLDLRDRNRSFSELAAYFAFYGVGDSKLTGNGEPERLTGVPVSRNFFPLLGVEPQLGRLFSEQECQWHGPRAVLLSQGFWKRRFASDPSIVGRALTLDDEPVTVIGVLPASFDFGSVFAPGSQMDLFFPFPLTPETNRWGNTLAVVGRLKPGATVESAQAEAATLGEQIRREHPERNDLNPRLSLLSKKVSARFRTALLVLAGAVGVFLLIVCANLSNLVIARSASRHKEMAIRAALGAGRFPLLRQVLTESMLISACGALLGVGLAFAGIRATAQLTSLRIPLLGSVQIDGSSLAFALIVALLTGLLLGLAPALPSFGPTLQDSLKDANRGSSQGQNRAGIRSGLVVVEMSLCFILLAGAGLLIRSFLRLLDTDLGFQPARAAALRIDPNSTYATQEQRNAYFVDALRRAGEVAGIEAAGLSDALPLGRNRTWGIGAKGQVYPRGNYPEGFVRIVSAGYFRAMGIPLRAGRDFTERDTKQGLPVIVINETLARNLWPGENPIGRIIESDLPERTVVGVVGDVRHLALEQGAGNEFYLPILQTEDYSSVDLVVRTALPPGELRVKIREALQPLEPHLATAGFQSLQQRVDQAASPRRFVVLLLSGFAFFALVLASLGIYGVISYSVNQRRVEIGIRMALGASPALVRNSILLQTMRLAGLGTAIGLAGAFVSARLAASLLYGVSPTDPLTFAGMVFVLVTVAVLAGYLPALRASRIEPNALLRAD